MQPCVMFNLVTVVMLPELLVCCQTQCWYTAHNSLLPMTTVYIRDSYLHFVRKRRLREVSSLSQEHGADRED